MNRTEQVVDRRAFLSYVVGSLIAVFYVPTLVPMQPTVSQSYAFGYNNRAGVVLLLVLLAAGAIWTRGLNLQFSAAGDSRPVSLRVLVLALLGVLSGCLAMYLIAGRFGGFGESSYEIDRIWLLSQGKTPYMDFEWPFGAALLYGPLWIAHLFSISLNQAYYLFWLLSFLLGTITLFTTVNWIDYPSNAKRTIFLLLYGAGFLSIVNMGTHYTYLRYTCPLFFVLLVHKLFKYGDTLAPILAAFLAVACTITLLLISPETAVAYAFSIVCVFVIASPKRDSFHITLTVGLLLAFGAVFKAASKLHMLDTMKASGGGADSWPVAFAPHILLFFSALFVCACYIFRRASHRRINDNTIGLIAFSIPMLAAALGRCDILHVTWNGEGIFLASLVYCSNFKNAWKWCRSVFLLIAIVYPALLAAWAYSGPMATISTELLRDRGNNSRFRAIMIHLADQSIAQFVKPQRRPDWEAKLKKAERPAVPDRIDFSQVYPSWHGTYLAPAGYKPHGDGFGTYLAPDVSYGYYEGFENANTAAAIHEKLTELQNHREMALLLPDHFLERRCIIDFSAMRRVMSMSWGFPYFGKGVHSENIRKPICDFIHNQYELEQPPTLDDFDYGLWVAKPISPAQEN